MLEMRVPPLVRGDQLQQMINLPGGQEVVHGVNVRPAVHGGEPATTSSSRCNCHIYGVIMYHNYGVHSYVRPRILCSVSSERSSKSDRVRNGSLGAEALRRRVYLASSAGSSLEFSVQFSGKCA